MIIVERPKGGNTMVANATLERAIKKLQARQILSEDEMSLLLAYLNQIEVKYASALGQLRRIAEILLAGGETVDLFDKPEDAQETQAKPGPGTQEILREYVDLLNALRHTPETDVADGEAHQIRLNRIAAVAADAALLFERGISIASPLRLNDENEEDEEPRPPQKRGRKRAERRKQTGE
jgi:hypothetical protein